MWPLGKPLKDHLQETKTVRVRGVKFEIRKLDVLKHMEGYKTLLKTFAVYEDKKQIESKDVPVNYEKAKDVYRDIFLSSVIKPKLSSSKDEPGQFVDDLFGDWDLCNGLYEAILGYTYGKKKVSVISLRQKF